MENVLVFTEKTNETMKLFVRSSDLQSVPFSDFSMVENWEFSFAMSRDDNLLKLQNGEASCLCLMTFYPRGQELQSLGGERSVIITQDKKHLKRNHPLMLLRIAGRWAETEYLQLLYIQLIYEFSFN